MGTTSCSNWKTKNDVVSELTNNINRSGFKVLGQKNCSDGVWYLVEKESRRFIHFGKITKSKGEYFLKDISEDMGPSYYSCPVKFIKQASEPINEYAKEWREKVISSQALAKKKVELIEGMNIKLYDKNYKVLSVHQLGRGKSYIIVNEHGSRFKLKRTQLKDIELA